LLLLLVPQLLLLLPLLLLPLPLLLPLLRLPLPLLPLLQVRLLMLHMPAGVDEAGGALRAAA